MIFETSRAGPTCTGSCRNSAVLSGLSFKLYTADRTAGALNVFSHRADVWDTDAETTGAVLAAHAATAILAQRQDEQLQAALLTRDRIGQAKGIIMATLRCR